MAATNNQYQKIVPFIIFVLALLLLFQLVRPMIVVLLSSFLLAYLSFPLYSKINKKIPNHSASIILSLIFVILMVSIPFAFLALELSQQGSSFYSSLSNETARGALFGFSCISNKSEVCALLNKAERFSVKQLSQIGLDKKLQELIPVLLDKVVSFISRIPIIIAEVFLSLIISFFILKDWEIILKKVEDLIPMRAKTKKRLIQEFGDIAHTVIYAQLFVALVQGVIGTIGFWAFGVPFPILLGVLTAFCALIPSIGTAIIWIPASFFLMISGYFSGDYIMLLKGVGLFFYCSLIVSTIDNILLATIVKARVKVNQILVIIGVIGGASMFGIMGIFIGPILLPLLITYFETFKERFN